MKLKIFPVFTLQGKIVIMLVVIARYVVEYLPSSLKSYRLIFGLAVFEQKTRDFSERSVLGSK